MRSFGYYWKEGFRNIFKHGFMSIAAVIIMIVLVQVVQGIANAIAKRLLKRQQ